MTDAQPADSNNSRRKPSRGFPVYALRGAVSGVKTAGASGGDHSRDAFASYLGHETTNSGQFKRKLASMKDWGLVETNADRVVLTDLGMRIAHPRSDDDEHSAIREAFLQADPFAATYKDLAKGVELTPERIGNMGVHEHGISPAAKTDFARSFIDSAAYAGLGRRNADGSIRLEIGAGESDLRRDPQPDGGNGDAPHDRARRDSHGRARRLSDDIGNTAPPTIRQEWAVEQGRVLFEVRLEGALPSSAFTTLGEVMHAVEKLVGSLGAATRVEAAAPSTRGEKGSPPDAAG